MIQFIGLGFLQEEEGARAVATVVDRGARVLCGGSAAVGGFTPGAGGRAQVRPGEWVRAGSLALRDAFFEVPGRVRRFWGFSLAGPRGWVALDPSLEPLGPVQLTPTPREDLLAWLAENPRMRSHVYSVLTPKDYFRYAVSGALATDVTQAGSLGLLDPGSTSWPAARMSALGLAPSWFPPVFDSAVPTGRISEEGIRRTSLPGGLWVVAGAETGAGSLVSAADVGTGVLLATARDPSTLELSCLAAGLAEAGTPEGFEVLPAPLAGHRVLHRPVRLAGGAGEAAAAASSAVRWAVARLREGTVSGLNPPGRMVLDYRPGRKPPWAEGLLAGAGLEAELSPFAGAEDPGIAFLAGLAQGAYRSPADLHRKLREVKEKAGREDARPVQSPSPPG